MKRWVRFLSIFVLFLIAYQANGQVITQTYTDPCDGKIYTVSVPIPNQVVVVVIRGKTKTFTYVEAQSGVMSTWITTILSEPCPVAITVTVAQQAAQAASSAASAAASSAASSASSSASGAASSAASNASSSAASSTPASTSSGSSSSSQSSSSSTESSSSSGSSESSGGGETKSESKQESSESKSESKEEKKSEEKKKEEEKKKKQEERKANPPMVKADLSVIQAGLVVIPTLNLNMSKSLNDGMLSWGLSTSIRADLKQIVVGGNMSNVIMKEGKVKGVTSTSVTYVTDWSNQFIFYGWSYIRLLNKGAVAGLSLSGNELLIKGNQLMLSPSVIVFYTRPIKVTKKQTVSPELYLISSPLMYGQKDKVATYDYNVSFFTGAGTDIVFTKKFKANFNFKVNISTNPNVPLMSVFSIGSKINL